MKRAKKTLNPKTKTKIENEMKICCCNVCEPDTPEGKYEQKMENVKQKQ